ncbi:septum formation initiator family protein [Clostridiaceae bacterium 35-E11]
MLKNKGKNKKRKGNKLFNIIITVFGIYVLGTLVNQQITLRELRKQEVKLQEQMKTLEEEAARLEEEKNMSDDPKHIEKIAREQLKMVKPNEIIYIDMYKSKYMQKSGKDNFGVY